MLKQMLAFAVFLLAASGQAIAGVTAQRECGWSDSKGKVKLLPEIEYLATFHNGVAAAKSRNGLWGYVDPAGKWVVPPEYDRASNPNEGFAMVERDGKRGYINLRQAKTPPSRWFDQAFRVSQGLGVVEVDGKRGYINPSTGQLAIPAKFDKAFDFTPDLVATVEADGKQRYIDRKGNWVAGGPWDDARDFTGGLAAVKRDGKWGYIDLTGNTAIPFKFEKAGSFRDDLANIEINGTHGFIGRDGNWVISPRYEHALDFGSGRSFARNSASEKYYLIDKQGKQLSPAIYSTAEQFNDGMAYAVTDGKAGLIDTQGRLVLPFVNLGSDLTRMTDDERKYIHEGKFSFCRDQRKPEPAKAKSKRETMPVTSDASCRPKGTHIRCQSNCVNGDCIVTYENGCKIRVRIQPRLNPFNNQFEYPSPSC